MGHWNFSWLLLDTGQPQKHCASCFASAHAQVENRFLFCFRTETSWNHSKDFVINLEPVFKLQRGWFYLTKKTALELRAKQQSASSKLLVSTQETRIESQYPVEFQRADETATEATASEWANGICHGCCWILYCHKNTAPAAWHMHVDRFRTASYLASGLKPAQTIQ